jgi:hypothetical protein
METDGVSPGGFLLTERESNTNSGQRPGQLMRNYDLVPLWLWLILLFVLFACCVQLALTAPSS